MANGRKKLLCEHVRMINASYFERCREETNATREPREGWICGLINIRYAFHWRIRTPRLSTEQFPCSIGNSRPSWLDSRIGKASTDATRRAECWNIRAITRSRVKHAIEIVFHHLNLFSHGVPTSATMFTLVSSFRDNFFTSIQIFVYRGLICLVNRNSLSQMF